MTAPQFQSRSDTTSTNRDNAKPLLLVVDDQPTNIKILHSILKDDHEVCMATSGPEAIEFCLLRQPDLILLDVDMPEMNGYEVCHWLKESESTREIPVIFVTAHNDPTAEAQGLNEGAVDFITKPVNSQVVRARVRTHLMLREQTAYLRSLRHRMAVATQAVGLSVWDIDLQSTPLSDANILNTYATQYEADNTGIEELQPLVHPDDQQRLLGRHHDAVRENLPIDIQFRVFNHNREERIFRSVAMIMTGADGNTRRMTGVNWDITELTRAERLKLEFVANVSHELRTPLTSIRGALGLLAGGAAGPVPSSFERPINIALRNSERLSILIDDLLDLEKLEIGKLQFQLTRQPLMPIIEQSIEANAGYASKLGVQFKLVNAAPEVAVTVDAHRCLQVLANLLSNAAKFSPKGSNVDVSLQTCDATVRIAVRDYGPGIPEEFRKRIFGKFSQADGSDSRNKGGTGLGLAISKAIVDRLGGRIGYETKLNEGTTFYFDLPIANEAVGGQVANTA